MASPTLEELKTAIDAINALAAAFEYVRELRELDMINETEAGMLRVRLRARLRAAIDAIPRDE
jgi:hypothetical protein